FICAALLRCSSCLSSFAFFLSNDTPTSEIYTLSLHDALPICREPLLLHRGQHADPGRAPRHRARHGNRPRQGADPDRRRRTPRRSEEHTSELQSRENLVCRLLLEKKKKQEEDVNREMENTV